MGECVCVCVSVSGSGYGGQVALPSFQKGQDIHSGEDVAPSFVHSEGVLPWQSTAGGCLRFGGSCCLIVTKSTNLVVAVCGGSWLRVVVVVVSGWCCLVVVVVGDGGRCWWWAWTGVGAWMSVGMSLIFGWRTIRLRYVCLQRGKGCFS